MFKNNKGFTLVELLAAMVILGLLITFAGPAIVNMANNSKNKIYVNDAQKLIAEAEYKIKASSSTIEKPDPGDCIAVSLVYLDSGDFDAPPNNGEYIKEASFVIVKNNGGVMEYSAALVEKMKKGGYKGVELTRNEELINSGLKHVKTFKESDVIYVTGSDFNLGYLQDKLGKSYIPNSTTISAIYNYPELGDDVTQLDSSGPIIRSATLATTTELVGSLKAALTLRVDDDKDRSNLKVYLSFKSFDDAELKTGEDYGNETLFVKNYDFSKMGKSYNGERVNLYIVVKDNDGNKAMQKVEYTIHLNEKPRIVESGSKLEKRDGDTVNMPNAKLLLKVSDDIDNANDLKVCITEKLDATGETCGEYRPYSGEGGLFEDNTMEYKFGNCSKSMCNRKSSTQEKSILIFVKDSSNSISDPLQLDYTISANESPKINSVSIDSNYKNFLEDTSMKDLSAQISLDVSDDIADEKYTITIVENGATKTFNDYSSKDSIDYTFSGSYDGNNRSIVIKVTDSEGASSTNSSNTYGPIYKNKGPTIGEFSVVTKNNVCSDMSYCADEYGNSNTVILTLDADDDIDSENDFTNLYVCISDNLADCTGCNSYDSCKNKKKSNGDKAYVSYKNLYTNENPNEYKFEGSNLDRTLNVVVIDSSGLTATNKTTYKLYKNQAPVVIDGPKLIKDNINEDLSFSNMKFFVRVRDDKDFLAESNDEDEGEDEDEDEDDDGGEDGKVVYDTVKKNNLNILYCFKNSSGVEKCSDNYERFRQDKKLDASFFDNVSGEIQLYAKIKDSDGAETTTESIDFDSDNFNDYPPNIVAAKGVRDSGNNVKISFIVEDPKDTYNICISGREEECNNYLSESYSGDDSSIHDYVYNNSDSLSEMYLFVKDSRGKISTYSFEVRDSRTCPEDDYYAVSEDNEYEVVKYEYLYASSESNPGYEITPSRCGGKCYSDSTSGGVNYGITGKYNRTIQYVDKFKSGTNCKDIFIKELITADCSFVKCFNMPSSDNYYKNAIGIYEYKSDQDISMDVDGKTYVGNTYYKLYNVIYNGVEENVTLEDANYKVLKAALDDGKFSFNANSVDSYLRVDDTGDVGTVRVDAKFGKVTYLNASGTSIGQEEFKSDNKYTLPNGTEKVRQEVKIKFSVVSNDNYSICVGSSSECDTFINSYEGNRTYEYTYYYDYNKDDFIVEDNNNEPLDLTLNLVAKIGEETFQEEFTAYRYPTDS